MASLPEPRLRPRACRCTATPSCAPIRTIANAFTQGLQYLDGVLYEGTGLNGRSSIRKVKFETGEVLQQRATRPEHFGEGITIWQTDLIQLTWQSGLAFVYDRATFEPRRTFTYVGEGWGLTHDETSLIMSDGTDALRFLDPATFKERRRVKVTAVGAPVPRSERARIRQGRGLRQHLADRLRRADRSRRPAAWPAGSTCAGC